MKKIGIEPIVIKSTKSPLKDKGSPFRMPTQEEVEDITHDIDTIHQRFIHTVALGRNLSDERILPLANGDIYDGQEAKNNLLIDHIGFLDDVIANQINNLNIPNPMVVRYKQPPSLRDLLGAQSQAVLAFDLQRQLEKWATSSRIQAIWLGQ